MSSTESAASTEHTASTESTAWTASTASTAGTAWTESTLQFAYCRNAGNCTKAVAGETIEWYVGPGEYCPECGEALAQAGALRRMRQPKNQPVAPPVEPPLDTSLFLPTAAAPAPVVRPKHSSSAKRPLPRWMWLAYAAIVAIVALGYVLRRGAEVGGKPAAALALCAAPSAAQLVSDLVRSYALKTGQPANTFVIGDESSCSVRFGNIAETPDAAIARDGIVVIVNPDNALARISETQLRAVYSGSIRDWSQLGGKPGPIIAMLPQADTAEAKALESSLFFGMPVDASVVRQPTSVDVTRAITGADKTSHKAIGLVVFSQAVAAKVVPIAYLPPPNVLSIGSRRYPYTLTVAVQTVPGRTSPAAQRFVDFARSRDGAAVVAKDGLIPRDDL